MSDSHALEMGDRFGVFAVFTPTQQAKVNFVERDAALNNLLVDALETPGKQIIVYGESGSGKSTLLKNKLDQVYSDHITTRCHVNTTFEQILLDGFDQLEKFYTASRREGQTSETSSTLEIELSHVKSSIAARHSQTVENTTQRAVPPQLTPQRLGQWIGSQNLCWVLEDFHKVHVDQKVALAQVLKVFMDLGTEYPQLKIIAIGATGTAREVVEYDSEMRNRISELYVPLMSSAELRNILRQGEKLLKVNFGDIAGQIVEYSAGLASVCHQLGLNLCLERGIRSTLDHRVKFDENDLKTALARYVQESSDTVKAAFERALRRHRIRVYDNCRLVLEALSFGPITGMRYDEILTKIKEKEPKYHASNLTRYLKALSAKDRGSIISSTLERMYRFGDPLHYAYAQALFQVNKPTTIKLELGNVFYRNLFIEISNTLKKDDFQLKLFDGTSSPYASEQFGPDHIAKDLNTDKDLDAETE